MREPDGFATRLRLRVMPAGNRRSGCRSPASFQVANALVAAGLCIATGSEPDAVFGALRQASSARRAGSNASGARDGAPIFVDYAHKPDALEQVLRTLRPYARARLVVVFGCGGDRDAGKRPIMGEIATRLADNVIVTDDNPAHRGRRRDPRRDSGCRARARSRSATAPPRSPRPSPCLRTGDVLVVAGKGHETGPDRRRRHAAVFRSRAVRAALAERHRDDRRTSLVRPRSRRAAGRPRERPRSAVGRRRHFDRHAHARSPAICSSRSRATPATVTTMSAAAFEKGAAAAVVDEDHADALSGPARSTSCATCCRRWSALGQAARARSQARIIAVTGSVGKTSTKEALRLVLDRRGRDACLGRLLQQSLGRAADARPHAARPPATASSRSA